MDGCGDGGSERKDGYVLKKISFFVIMNGNDVLVERCVCSVTVCACNIQAQ